MSPDTVSLQYDFISCDDVCCTIPSIRALLWIQGVPLNIQKKNTGALAQADQAENTPSTVIAYQTMLALRQN